MDRQLDALAAKRVADTIVERFDLQPPVDVHSLLRQRATVERAEWPWDDVDAVVVGLASPSPHVLIRQTDNPLRERFTMAHEYGHLTIPWHLPAPTCHVDEAALDWVQSTTEQQADIFASGILLPDRWLRQVTDECDHRMTEVLHRVQEAQVTTAAALQALRRYLLPGWVFSAYADKVMVASQGTVLPPETGSVPLQSQCLDSGAAQMNGYPVRWYRLTDSSVALPVKDPADTRTDHQILLDAIATFEADDDKQKSIAQSANGKVGGTLNRAGGRSSVEMFQAMLHRLNAWEYSQLLELDDFRLWLAQSARRIESGTTKRRSRR